MTTLRRSALTAFLVASLVVALDHEWSGAGTAPQEGRRHYRLAAVLKPEYVVRPPVGIRSGTTGTIALTVDRNAMGGGHVIKPLVVLEGLTGPAIAVHIHTGRAGRSGPVLYTLCAPNPGAAATPRCNHGPGGFVWRAAPFFDPAVVGPTYVDVHTKRNPGGELRGQVSATPLER